MDWNYDFLQATKDKIFEVMKNMMLSLQKMDGSIASQPEGGIRWSADNKRFEMWDGSAWVALVDTMNQQVSNADNLGGQSPAHYLAWENLTGIPVSFPPSSHGHDETYLALAGGTVTGVSTFSDRIETNEIRGQNGNQVVINAGEAHNYTPDQVTGGGHEKIFFNSEGGFEFNCSPDNWASGWGGRVTYSFTASGATLPGTTTVDFLQVENYLYIKRQAIPDLENEGGHLTLQNAESSNIGNVVFDVYRDELRFYAKPDGQGSNTIYKLPFAGTGAAQSGGNYTIWHAGNHGAGSGLDADKLDGKHASELSLAISAEGGNTNNLKTSYADKAMVEFVARGKNLFVSALCHFYKSGNSSNRVFFQLKLFDASNNTTVRTEESSVYMVYAKTGYIATIIPCNIIMNNLTIGNTYRLTGRAKDGSGSSGWQTRNVTISGINS